jgi:regulatory protein
VRAHLERKGVSERLVGECVETLVEQRLLDDERFARLFVSDKRELEQWGSERIRRGLLARGIDRQLAEQALAGGSASPGGSVSPGGAGPMFGLDARLAGHGDGATDEPTELDRALGVLRRRYPTPPADRRERERALGVLLRKGYESELALDALSAYARGD